MRISATDGAGWGHSTSQAGFLEWSAGKKSNGVRNHRRITPSGAKPAPAACLIPTLVLRALGVTLLFEILGNFLVFTEKGYQQSAYS